VGENGKHDLIKQTALKSSEIYEHVSRRDLKRLYQQMTVFLCLSSYESFGMVCSEAMAHGCILLSTNVGFVRGLTNQEHYLQINRNHPKAIAMQIREISQDVHSYSPIRVAAQKRVQELQWSHNVETLENGYKNMLAGF